MPAASRLIMPGAQHQAVAGELRLGGRFFQCREQESRYAHGAGRPGKTRILTRRASAAGQRLGRGGLDRRGSARGALSVRRSPAAWCESGPSASRCREARRRCPRRPCDAMTIASHLFFLAAARIASHGAEAIA